MITEIIRLTAAAIAKESGVDELLAQAKPEDKLALDSQRTSGWSLG